MAASRGFDPGGIYAVFFLFAGVALFVAIVARSRKRQWGITSSIVYLVLGAIAAGGLALLGVPPLEPLDGDGPLIERLSEFAVIIALFAGGLRIDRSLSWRNWRSTAILILVVMPLTIAGVAVFGMLAMGLSLGAAIILGAILAPTDPVLAGEVQVGPPGEGGESEPRFALTSESGFNDGLAFPFVFLGLFVAAEGGTSWFAEWALADGLWAISAGLAIGAAVGALLGVAVERLNRHGMMESGNDGWIALAAVAVIYGLTELAGAYGFLAAFAGGLAYRRIEVRSDRHHRRVNRGAETVERVTELALLVILGSTVTIAGLSTPGLSGWLLAPFLLLFLRPALVGLSFLRSGVPRKERRFIGWFGIRGIGSFYYAAVAIDAGVLAASEISVIYWTMVVVVAASIVVHGITSGPFSRRLEDSG